MPRPLLWILAAALLLPSIPARAVDFTPDPFEVGVGTLLATVDVLSCELGLPAGATQLVGSTGASDLTIVFTLTVAEGSPIAYDGVAAQATASDFSPYTVTGAGVLAGSGLAPTAASLSTSLDRVRFAYADDAVTAGAGLTPYFVSFAGLMPGDLFYAGMYTFIPPTLPGGGSAFGRLDLGSTTAVPEPALGGLVAAAAVAARRRRRKA